MRYYDELPPEEAEAGQREVLDRYAGLNPGYVGIAIWWALDLLMIGLGVFIVTLLAQTPPSGSWLPIIIVLVISAAAIPFAFVLAKWTREIAQARRRARGIW